MFINSPRDFTPSMCAIKKLLNEPAIATASASTLSP